MGRAPRRDPYPAGPEIAAPNKILGHDRQTPQPSSPPCAGRDSRAASACAAQVPAAGAGAACADRPQVPAASLHAPPVLDHGVRRCGGDGRRARPCGGGCRNGPIELDMATPWLKAAIEENFGGKHTVVVGGTQIERDEKGRTSLRLRDIVVRDADGTVVASAPKAEGRSVRHEPADGPGARAEPQSGRRRNGGAHRDRRPRDRVRRRRQAADRHRRAGADPGAPGQPADASAPQGDVALGSRGRGRHHGLDRRRRRDRPRRPRSARTRSQERQPHRRRPAQRQALDLRPDQREPDAARARRRDLSARDRTIPNGPGC